MAKNTKKRVSPVVLAGDQPTVPLEQCVWAAQRADFAQEMPGQARSRYRHLA